MTRITIDETTISKNWPMILQILERSKYHKEASSVYVAEFDIKELDSLADLRAILELLSPPANTKQNTVLIKCDKHFISYRDNFMDMIKCYSKTRLPGCDDLGSYCCKTHVHKQLSSDQEAPYFQACRELDVRLCDGDDPSQYIRCVENLAISTETILCPNFNKTDWQSKAEEYIRLRESSPEEPPRQDRNCYSDDEDSFGE